MNTPADFPILSFANPSEWDAWMQKNHRTSPGIWIRFYKKISAIPTITYDQALDTALCFGWIDSQVKKYDEKSYVQKFTPRRSKSIWSKTNTEHINRLIKEGKMQPAGLQLVNEAKADGRWDRAYHPSRTIELPKEFLQALSKRQKAYTFFQTLNKANTYAIAWRLQTAKKPETKQRRMKNIIEMLERNEKFHE